MIPESMRLRGAGAVTCTQRGHASSQTVVTNKFRDFRWLSLSATTDRRLNWPRWFSDQTCLREGGPRLEKTVREASGQAFGRNVSRPIVLGVNATMIDWERRPEPKSRWTRHVAQCEESFEPGARSEPPLSLAEKPEAAAGDVATEVLP